MAIKDIIQEIKTLSSRQVLVLVLLGSLYLNYDLVRLKNTDSLLHAKEIKQLEKEKSELKETERLKTEEAIRLNIEYLKKITEKTYQHEKFVDSIKLVNALRK